jgi:hypothetical protein
MDGAGSKELAENKKRDHARQEREKWLRLPWPLAWQPNEYCKLISGHRAIVLYSVRMNKRVGFIDLPFLCV